MKKHILFLLCLTALSSFAQVAQRGEDAYGVLLPENHGRLNNNTARHIVIGEATEKQIADALACPDNAAQGWTYASGFTGLVSSDLGRADGYSSRAFNSFSDNVYYLNGVRFYGFFDYAGTSFQPCDERWTLDANGDAETVLNFEICFYPNDKDGYPDLEKPIGKEIVPIKGKSTHVETYYGTVFYFDAPLSKTVDLEEGWFSVTLCDDGTGPACTFCLYGHAGVGSQTIVMINQEYYMGGMDPATYCLLTDGTLLPGMTPPEKEDDIIDWPDEDTLPVPVPQAATDVTSYGFTANWTPCKNVKGYEVYTMATKALTTSDNVFHYLNTSFDNYEDGTIDTPAAGVFYGDITDIGRYGWVGSNTLTAKGAIGMDNSMYGIINGAIMSPILNLSQGDGTVNVKMNVIGRNAKQVNLYLFEDLTELAHVAVPVTNEWQEHTVTLEGATENTYLLIEMDQNSPGTMFISDFDMWQELPASAVPLSPYRYDFTIDPNATSLYIDCSEPLYTSEEFAFSMTSFYDTQRSEKSDVMFVSPRPEGINAQPSTLNAPLSSHYDLQGRLLPPSAQHKGLIIKHSSKVLHR